MTKQVKVIQHVNVTLSVGVTEHVRVTRQLRVTVEVWGKKICLGRGSVKMCE